MCSTKFRNTFIWNMLQHANLLILIKCNIISVAVDYLQDEANIMPRIGAVGIGGLSGLIFSLRGGILKRLFYTTTGASIVGCICFPKEAKQALNTVEHYGNISYNFIYGGMYITLYFYCSTQLLI